jgi:hypothetical protein
MAADAEARDVAHGPDIAPEELARGVGQAAIV